MVGDRVMVGGRYELGDLLGRGGMAEVRRAVDTRLGRLVAVKRLRADLAADSTFQARFRREAQAAAGLNHPAIVSVYDTGEEPDPVTEISIPYIVMELIDGPTLSDVLRTERKLPPQRALELTRAVLEALDHSHRAGIVHRDIKPANVMLAATGGVKVMDFGIARAVADTSGSLTRTAAVIGTASYLSPEQARGRRSTPAATSIRSAVCSTNFSWAGHRSSARCRSASRTSTYGSRRCRRARSIRRSGRRSTRSCSRHWLRTRPTAVSRRPR
jgi:eukaryotic-like serine/threonine-protein kinase